MIMTNLRNVVTGDGDALMTDRVMRWRIARTGVVRIATLVDAHAPVIMNATIVVLAPASTGIDQWVGQRLEGSWVLVFYRLVNDGPIWTVPRYRGHGLAHTIEVSFASSRRRGILMVQR